jgi:hypothetical protein
MPHAKSKHKNCSDAHRETLLAVLGLQEVLQSLGRHVLHVLPQGNERRRTQCLENPSQLCITYLMRVRIANLL